MGLTGVSATTKQMSLHAPKKDKLSGTSIGNRQVAESADRGRAEVLYTRRQEAKRFVDRMLANNFRALEKERADMAYTFGVLQESQGSTVDAEKWLLKAAEQGHVKAQFNLGLLLETQGKLKGAEKWYLAAAKQSDLKAQVNLNLLLEVRGRKEEIKNYFEQL